MILLDILAAFLCAIALHILLALQHKAHAGGRRSWPYAAFYLAFAAWAVFNLPMSALWWLVGFTFGPPLLFWLAVIVVSFRLCWWALTEQVNRLSTAAELVVALKVAAALRGEDAARDANPDAEALSGTD